MVSAKQIVALAKSVYGEDIIVSVYTEYEPLEAVSIQETCHAGGPITVLEVDDEDGLLMAEAALSAKRKRQTGGKGRPRKDGS